METFIPSFVHNYTVDELYAFIRNGEVTFEELQMLGLFYEKQQQLQILIKTGTSVEKEEKEDFDNAEKESLLRENRSNFNGAIDYWKKYLEKWEKCNPHPAPEHIQYCRNEIDRLLEIVRRNVDRLKKCLIEDMRERTWEYHPLMMKWIFGKVTPDSSEFDDSPAGQFLSYGLTLTMDDLVEAGLIPGDDKRLQKSIFEEVWEVPQKLSMDELGEFPKDRTDVYMMGVKGSGKTCALAGIVNELYESGEVSYEPQLNSQGQDKCAPYYYALIEGIRNYKALAPTVADTVSFMKLDIGPKLNKPLTFVEMSGEAFSSLASSNSTRYAWDEMKASSCLKNTNDKILCFFIDYQLVLEASSSGPSQDIVLTQALTVLSHDGPDLKKPEKGCTMSRVKTVAIVVTKSDLMGSDLSFEDRKRMASEYVTANLKTFIRNLKELCKKHDINHPAKNEVYVFPYSLGDFYVGKSLKFKREDSRRFVDFLQTVTGPRRNSILDYFRV